MVSQGAIRKVDEPTDWCSSVDYSTKKDGSIRVCIDPQRLNAALRRCPHKIPTLEEINPELAKAKRFSKLDAKAGYWSVRLNEDSQLLTTFRTPFGRYCWRRLPFGLNVFQDLLTYLLTYQLDGESTRRRIGIQFCKVPHQAKKYLILYSLGTPTPTMVSHLTMTKFGTSKTCRHPEIVKICIDSSA